MTNPQLTVEAWQLAAAVLLYDLGPHGGIDVRPMAWLRIARRLPGSTRREPPGWKQMVHRLARAGALRADGTIYPELWRPLKSRCSELPWPRLGLLVWMVWALDPRLLRGSVFADTSACIEANLKSVGAWDLTTV